MKNWHEKKRLRAEVRTGRKYTVCTNFGEDHYMLSETYDWFTEGFDTIDLQEAKALLAKLTFEQS
jgi:hypothetical protein